MLKREFWAIIDASRKKSEGDPDAQVEALREELAELSPAEIVSFQKHYDDCKNRAYDWGVWGAAYLIGGGCSDDGFLDFRAWLISRGQKVYEAALKDPDSLARAVKEEDDDCQQMETFQYVAGEVWAEKTGRDFAEFPRSGSNIGQEPAGEPWSEEGDELRRRFPKLWKKFGDG